MTALSELAFARLPRRDFFAIFGSLAAIVTIAWWYLYSLSSAMPGDMAMTEMGMEQAMVTPSWGLNYSLLMFLMWSVMMVGMMLPSVLPTVMIYSMVAKKAAKDGKTVATTGYFVSGYILIWIGFSLLATISQYALEKLDMLSAMMVSNNNILGGALLLIAGAWQFTPLKDQCLEQCRSPVEFIYQNWQKGNAGAMQMGIRHGLFCLGCCWALMLLLFVGGVMNLLWIAILTIFVLLEKILPFGSESGKVIGVLMLIVGTVFLI
jgi:predicted metal-binding membrane protein